MGLILFPLQACTTCIDLVLVSQSVLGFSICGRKDFAEYAEVCFSSYGDRVKRWLTFNEPQQSSVLGFGVGIHAPGRCSDRKISAEGNSFTEPYVVVHHQLLAHAAAYDLYKRKFKVWQMPTVCLQAYIRKSTSNSGALAEVFSS